jgi:2-polyprenyl-6-methoxyphenol hydroxylase-like FAD-dependent oxidoreductase
MSADTYIPILIVGAGISGLALAQCLQEEGIPFRLVERRPEVVPGDAGWGFTINWSLENLVEMLPPSLSARLVETYVDRQAVQDGKDASFPFFNLLTGELLFKVPPGKRVRVNRDKLRKLLRTDLPIEVGQLQLPCFLVLTL